jgi:hypothetical protein
MAGVMNKENEGGIVLSNTFNLTRITAFLTLLIGALTAVSGSQATPPATDTPVPPAGSVAIDWANFNSNQRLVIIVAVIAAFAIVSAADILGRSIATGKAVGAGLIPMTKPQPAQRQMPGNDPRGVVYAMRGGEQPTYLFQSTTGEPAWVPADQITFTTA